MHGPRNRAILRPVKFLQIAEADAFNVSTDAAFGEGQGHPRFKLMDDFRRDTRMLEQKIIQPVRPRQHQCPQPRGAGEVALLQAVRVDEQPLAQITVNGGLALCLRQHSQAVEVVTLDAAEVVLGLGVDGAEYRIRIGLAVDMRDAPVVADDADILGVLLPARMGLAGRRGGDRRQGKA
jgi:hypothetical protein